MDYLAGNVQLVIAIFGEELLFKLHNLMANKELGDHVFFEGIEYEGHECEGYGLIDNEDSIPVFFIVCGS